MKTTKFFKELSSALFILLAAGMIFVSCKKDDTEEPEATTPENVTTTSESVSESEYEDIYKMSAEAIDSLQVSSYTISVAACASLTYDTTTQVAIIDFGTSGCTGLDGRVRSGMIVINYNGVYPEPGSTLIITANDYTVDGMSISGTYTINGVVRNTSGHLEFTTSLADGVLTYPDGSHIEWEFNRTKEWMEGEGTGIVLDDVWSITGSSSGKAVNNVTFTTVITEPVIMKSECWASQIVYPVSGEKEIIPMGLSPRVIDFGEGNCDKIVYLIVNGNTYTVTLP